jgi:hypothetical protein
MTIFEEKGISSKVLKSIGYDEKLLGFCEDVMRMCSMNANSFKNLVRYSREIALRENIEFSKLALLVGLDEIKNDPKKNEKAKGEEILNRLYELRYPDWSAKKLAFKKLRDRYRASTGGEIEFPEFAEGNSFKVSFTIKNEEDIEKMIESISNGREFLQESLRKIKE